MSDPGFLAAPPSVGVPPVSRALLIIVATSLALKLLLVWMVAGMPCTHDQCDYLDLATGLLAGDGIQVHDGYVWPPGYITFLAACKVLFGDTLTAPRLFQVLASTASVPFMFLLGRRFGGHRAGLAAAAVFAFDPNLVGFTHLLWPATIYIFLLLWASWLLVRTDALAPTPALAAGMLLGGAAYFKGMALYLAPLAAGWLFWQALGRRPRQLPVDSRPRPWLPATLLVLATLATILPWSIRNSLVYGRLLLLDASAGRNLYIGTNIPPPSNWDMGLEDRRRIHGGRPRCDDANVVDRDRCEVRHAVSFMVRHPVLMLTRVPTKLADLFNPSSFVIRHARLDKYPHLFSRGEVQALSLATAAAWIAVAVLGVAGLILLPAAPGAGLLRLVVLFHLGIHALTFGLTRFRLPLTPFLMVAAAPFLAASWRPLLEGQPRVRILIVIIALVVLLGLFAVRLGTVFDVLLPGS